MKISEAIYALEELRDAIGDVEVVFSETPNGIKPTRADVFFPLPKVKQSENGHFTIRNDVNGRN